MKIKLYVLRLIKMLDAEHNSALDRRGGWQYAQLLDRALTALEAVASIQ